METSWAVEDGEQDDDSEDGGDTELNGDEHDFSQSEDDAIVGISA